MASKSVQRKSVYAIALSAALLAASAAPAAAASRSSTFLNFRAFALNLQSMVVPRISARQINLIYNRNPDRAVALVTQMYARNPTAANTMLGTLINLNPTVGDDLVQDLQDNNVPVSPI